MPDIPPNTGIAPTPEQIQQAQAATAAAEATNQAWRSNTLPVLPRMGGESISNDERVIAYDTTGLTDPHNQQGRPYYISAQEDAARESAKHEAAFHPESFYNANIGNLANVPLSQIASRYGSDFADYVQGHYTQNPTANFQAINAAYTAQQGMTVGSAATYKQGTMVTNIGAGEGGFTGRAAAYAESWTPLTHSVKYGGEAPNSVQGYYTPVGSNPFKSDTAAGIAWDVAKTGGYIGTSLSGKVVNPDTGEKINVPGAWVWDQKTSEGKQIADYGNVVSSNQMVEKTISPGRTVYVPIGEMEQQLRTDSKLIVAERGAYEVWQTPKNTMPGSDFVRIYPMITAGGSDFALQSGMVSGKAQTPWVVDEYGMNPLWKASDAARVADIQANPQNYSRLGSELYGGIVQKLQPYPYGTIELAWGRGQTVEPGVYPAVRENFAGLVNFESVNAPKGTVSDASDLPKFGSISPEQFNEMPSLQKVDMQGNLNPVHLLPIFPEKYSVAASTASDVAMAAREAAPAPFKSESSAAVTATTPYENPVSGLIRDPLGWAGGAAELAGRMATIPFREQNLPMTVGLIAPSGPSIRIEAAGASMAAPTLERIALKPTAELATREATAPMTGLGQMVPGAVTKTYEGLRGMFGQSVSGAADLSLVGKPAATEVRFAAEEYGQVAPGSVSKATSEILGARLYDIGAGVAVLGTAGSAIWEKAGEIKEETLGYVSEAVSPRSNEPLSLTPYQQSILGGYSGGLIGYQLFGEKSPEVIKGFAASVVDFFPSMVGWTPVADSMRTTDPGQADYLAGKTHKETALQGMYTQGAEKYGVDAEGKIKIDTTNPEAVKFQNQYESARTDYTDYMKSGVDKGYTQYTSKGLVANPDLTYNYGEYSKWGIGAGAVVRETLGYNKEQLDVYGAQLSGQKGIFSGNLTLEGLSNTEQQLVFGVGEKLSTHPEEVVTAYGAGIATVGFGEVVGGVAGASGIAASAASFGAAHPVIGAIGSAAWTYGIPVALAGATYYSATEGLTASPEKATMNVGGMLPSLGAMVYGGATGFGALRAADAGYLGFRNTGDVDITKPLTGREVLGKDVLAVEDLAAPQDWRYNLQTKVNPPEPFAVTSTGTRINLGDTTPVEISGGSPAKTMPWDAFPGVRQTLEGSEMGSVAMSTEIGFRSMEKSGSSMSLSMDKLLSDMGLYTQEPSARTTTMRESQRAAWQEPVRIQTGEMPMDMLPGVSKIGAGLEPMALPNPFAGLADQMGLRIEPATPKGIGVSTERGYGFSGAPMSEQMLQQVVTQGPIKTPTSYRSAMDVVIGQEEMRMRVNPAIDAATANEIVPSITQLPKGQQISGNIFDIWTGIEESAKRPAEVTKTIEPRLFNEPAKMVEEPLVQKTPSPIGASLSKQINTPVQTPQTSYRIATAQSPASGAVVRTSQIPGTVAGATVSPRNGLVPASIQLPKVAQTSSVGLGTVTGTTQASRQSQTPFTALTPAIDQVVTQMQIPQTVQIARQASINDAAPFVLYPLVPLSKIALPGTDPFRPPTPATGGGGGGGTGGGGGGEPGGGGGGGTGWLPLGGGIGGQGGSGGSLKRFKRYMEYFPVGLDISMFGTTRGANPFTNPAGRVKYMPRDAGAFESPSAKRDIKAAKYAQAIRKMKPLKVPGGNRNIFMK